MNRCCLSLYFRYNHVRLQKWVRIQKNFWKMKQVTQFEIRRWGDAIPTISSSGPQIYTEDPRPPIPLRVKALSVVVGLNLKVFGFLPTMQAEEETQNQCVHDLCAPCSVSRIFYLHAQTAVDASDIGTYQTVVNLITRKRPPIWAPCRDNDGAGSGLSGVYICMGLKLGVFCVWP